jgi:hypothetical protein
MPYYCARLLIVCLVNDRKPRRKNTCDYPFVLFRASNDNEAMKRALELGKEQETRYKNSKSQWVRWAFVSVQVIKILGRRLDGIEVGSLLDVYVSEKPIPFRKRFSPEKSTPLITT